MLQIYSSKNKNNSGFLSEAIEFLKAACITWKLERLKDFEGKHEVVRVENVECRNGLFISNYGSNKGF